MQPERAFAGEPERLLTRRQLLRRGVRSQDLATAVRAGAIVRVGRGLYAGGPLAALDRIRAVALESGGVISHESAALIWGVPVPGIRTVSVTLPRNRHKRNARGVVTHWADLPPSEIEVVSGIAVTSPLRTLIDLARTFQLPEAVAAADAALRMGLAQPADLAGLLRYVGRGAHLVRRMAALADGRAESPHESRVRVLLVLGGLPPEELQLVVADPAGRWRYRFDLAYPSAKTAVEADGLEYHGGAERVRRDALRDRRAAELGWLTVRLHDADIRASPAETVTNLRRVLTERWGAEAAGDRGQLPTGGERRRSTEAGQPKRPVT